MDELAARKEEAREALELAIAEMGTNTAKVEDAERRCEKAERQRDEGHNLLIMLASDEQKRNALVVAVTLGIEPLVARLIGVDVDPDSVGSPAIGLNLVWDLAEGATNSMGWDMTSPEVTGLQGGTPLCAAIKADELGVLELLLNAGANIEMEAPNLRHKPLMQAAYYARPACIRRLLAAGVQVDAVNSQGRTALHRLADSSCVSPCRSCCTHLLLKAGADKDARTPEQLTPLMLLAGRYRPDATVLVALLENHADETLRDEENRTALDIAVEAENEKVAALLRHGVPAETAREALVLAVLVFGVSTTLMQRADQECAKRNEAIDALEAIMTEEQMQIPHVREAREACQQTRSTLRQHQRQQTSSPREALVARRPDATAGTQQVAVLLAWRALGVNAEHMEQAAQGKDLLDTMLMVLATTVTGEQKGDALVLAALQGNRAAVGVQIVAGADLDHECTAGGGHLPHLFHPSEEGLTPLIAVIKGGDQEVVNQVLKAGADPEKEYRRRRPLMCAACCYKETPHSDVCVQRLLDSGASVDARGEDDGMSALHWAALCGPRDYLNDVEATEEDDRRVVAVFSVLLEAGANKALVDGLGRTALEIAEQEGYTQAAELLRD